MKTLYLLRHAKSSWEDPSLKDFDRPLNSRGRRDGKRMGRYLSEMSMHPAVALCSAAKRTRETLDLIRAGLGGGTQVKVMKSLYMAGPEELQEQLTRLDDSALSAMIISHNPGIQELALSLADSGDTQQFGLMLGPMRGLMQEKFPTAALAVLTSEATRWADLEPGALCLENFVRPRDLIAQDEPAPPRS